MKRKIFLIQITFCAIYKLVHIYHVKILCEMYANALFTLKFMWGTINYAMCKCLKQVVHVIFKIQHGLVFYTKFPLQVQYYFNRACVYSHKSIYSHQSDGIIREHWLLWTLAWLTSCYKYIINSIYILYTFLRIFFKWL